MRSTTPFCVGTLCLASWVMLPATALAQQGPSLQYQPVPGESIGLAVSAGTPVQAASRFRHSAAVPGSPPT